MLENWYYLIALVATIMCLTAVDYRFKLAYWSHAKATAYTLVASIGIFIIWDILGILLGIFYHGGSNYTLPVRIAPEFPIEELFFLYVLCYVTLLIYRWSTSQWPRT